MVCREADHDIEETSQLQQRSLMYDVWPLNLNEDRGLGLLLWTALQLLEVQPMLTSHDKVCPAIITTPRGREFRRCRQLQSTSQAKGKRKGRIMSMKFRYPDPHLQLA